MKIDLEPGKYVVAVSGGVDSIVLLNLLTKQPKLELIVAHFDHGIRQDSAKDRKLVEKLSKEYDLPFEYAEGRLGPKASESAARIKRYEFLYGVRAEHQAKAVITAHHQDDLLETAIINMLRGTGRRGLSSLKSTDEIKRPLLSFTKKQLINYARANGLTWCEDSTNQDEAYLRNWVHRQIIPKLSENQKANLLQNISQASRTNQIIEQTISQLLDSALSNNRLDRRWFNQLPHDVAKEIMMEWLRQNELEFDRRRVEQLVIAAKTYMSGKTTDIDRKIIMEVSPKYLALTSRER